MASDPQSPARERRVRSPRFVFVVCLVGALVSAIVLGLFTLVAAAVLVVTAMVFQARGKDPARWFAASLGVAAGALIWLVAAKLIGS
jgi:4-hydroxybenzoate polyprenyltransferase